MPTTELFREMPGLLERRQRAQVLGLVVLGLRNDGSGHRHPLAPDAAGVEEQITGRCRQPLLPVDQLAQITAVLRQRR